MLDYNSKLCLVLSTQEEVDFYKRILTSLGFKRIEYFVDSNEAYEFVTRNQQDLFLTKLNTQPLSGIVFIQKIRETGNYGLETHMIIADNLSQEYIFTLQDLEIPYVLLKPFTPQRVEEKVKYVLESECHLSKYEEVYRNSKSAFTNNIIDMALELARSLIQIDEKQEKGHLLVAEILLKKGDLAESGEIINRIVKSNPSGILPKIKLSKWYMANSDFSKASECLNSLAKLNPYHINILANAGHSNLEIGNMDLANSYLDKITALDENNASIKNIKSKIANILKEKNSGKSEFEIVTEINNEGIRLVSEQNDLSKAIHYLQKSLEKISENPHRYIVYYNLGLIYKKSGDLDTARRNYIRAIEINPNYEKAKVALKKVLDTKKNEDSAA